MFNPIKHIWSNLKADKYPQILMGKDNSNMTQTKYHFQQLECVLKDNITNITIAKYIKYITNIQRFIPNALNMMDVCF
ncbi:hypothetical protein M0802_012063 [Mischocyttarus mexicanus]|nr:hypothetical protein M0802_012063 [Mischocyttarus mexicanus]